MLAGGFPWDSGGTIELHQSPNDAGDGSTRVSHQAYDAIGGPAPGGARSIVTRRGVAHISSTRARAHWRSDFAEMERNTAKILPRMFTFDNPACDLVPA